MQMVQGRFNYQGHQELGFLRCCSVLLHPHPPASPCVVLACKVKANISLMSTFHWGKREKNAGFLFYF